MAETEVKSINGRPIADTTARKNKADKAGWSANKYIGTDANGNLVEKDPPETGTGGITQETDPTVPAWAKAAKKPTYTKDEIGLGNVDNVRQYSASNPPPYPVASVNGETGAVNLDAAKVGALPASTKIPSKTSDITNDSGFITRLVADLANYYTKSQTYTQAEVNALVSAIPKFAISVVASLPTAGISETTVYLVKSGVDGDLYTEYIYVNGAWEILGSQRVDLTGYATETWVDEKIANFLTADKLTAAIIEAALGYTPANADDVPAVDNTLKASGAAADAAKVGEELTKVSTAIADLPNNETLIDNVTEQVKEEMPFVKTAEQPTFVNSIDEMTDASKVYVLSTDGYFYKWLESDEQTLTAGDFTACAIGGYGNISSGNSRIATTQLLPLVDNIISVNCPEPYQYIVYYFSGNVYSDISEVYVGKTTFKSGSIDDLTTDAIASGTMEGAKYCRISLRDGTDTSANISGRISEFMDNVTIVQSGGTLGGWVNTGLAYNQPADYEDRLIELEKKQAALSPNSLFNPFALSPIYHHLNQEDIRQCDIPAQSIYDVNYAKSLGFNMIEVNPQKCSDGVFVCKHGVGGTLGYGLKAEDGNDYSNTTFASVSSDWLRNNIKYTTIEKFSGHIPTLEEVCAECKKLSMAIKVGSAEAVEIARKHLPDDMIWSTQNKRGDFRGLIEYVWYNTQTVDACISTCLNIGTPLNIVIASGEFRTHTDDEIKELTQKAHQNSFTVGMVYPNSSDIVRALSLGVDAIGSVNNNINLFDVGDVLNIRHLNDTKLNLVGGALYKSDNDVITMAELSSLIVSADNIPSGKLSLRIRYNGSITINDDMTYESDGTVIIPYAVVLQRKSGFTHENWITITANSTTTIYELSLSCSDI